MNTTLENEMHVQTQETLEQELLAIDGGQPAFDNAHCKPVRKVDTQEFMELADSWGFSEATKAVIQAAIDKDNFSPPLLSRYYNPRPSKVKAMEELACELFGVPHALGVNSGTSALHAAYTACGLGPGCEVIVPAYTFFATIAEVVTVGAIPVIAEVDESLTLDPRDVERKITPRTKAIVPVHIGGQCSDMDALMALACKHNLRVIEDTAQACGGTYHGRKLGTIGDIGCFSLSSYKPIGAGEAGLVLCKDDFLFTRALNDHDTGACWRPDRFAVEQRDGELFCGFNFKMSELEGAVNLSQLRKLEGRTSKYQENYARIRGGMSEFQGVTQQNLPDPEGIIGYQLAFFVPDAQWAARVAAALCAEGVVASTRGGKTSRDWHIFAYWEHILKQKSATPDGFPWTHPRNAPHLPEYSPDMCPATLDLLSRTVFVNLQMDYSLQDCDGLTRALNKVLGAFFGKN